MHQNKKLGGNAQKRTKKSILQHGSIPLKKDSREHAGYSGIYKSSYEPYCAKKFTNELEILK